MISIDIGWSNCKIAVRDGSGMRLVSVHMPENIIRTGEDAGEIASPETMAQFLKKVRSDENIRGRDCVLVLSPSQVYFRSITLPPMSIDELKLNLPYEFRDFIMGDPEEYVYDYAVDTLERDEQGDVVRMNLYAAAVAKSMVETYATLLKKAGLRLKMVTPAPMAYMRLIDAADPAAFALRIPPEPDQGMSEAFRENLDGVQPVAQDIFEPAQSIPELAVQANGFDQPIPAGTFGAVSVDASAGVPAETFGAVSVDASNGVPAGTFGAVSVDASNGVPAGTFGAVSVDASNGVPAGTFGAVSADSAGMSVDALPTSVNSASVSGASEAASMSPVPTFADAAPVAIDPVETLPADEPDQEEASGDKDVVLVDLGYHEVTVSLFSGSRYDSARTIDFGCADLDRAIADLKGIDAYVASSYKLTNFEGVLDEPECLSVCNRFAVEVSKVVNFYNFNNPDREIGCLYFLGGGARIPQITSAISEAVSVPTSVVDPLLPAPARGQEHSASCALAVAGILEGESM